MYRIFFCRRLFGARMLFHTHVQSGGERTCISPLFFVRQHTKNVTFLHDRRQNEMKKEVNPKNCVAKVKILFCAG